MIKLGVVMDPISKINTKKDSSFAILLEAQRRSYQIHYMEMGDLYLINGEARAHTSTINIEKKSHNWCKYISKQDLLLSTFDVILMRKDPPFNSEYIFCTYILQRAQEKGVLIINNPQSLRDFSDKFYSTWFSDLTPETLITRKKEQINAFRLEHKDIILKPLDKMGGASIFLIKDKDPNINVIIETITEYGNKYCMVQKYIPDILNGDKRVLVIDGEPVPYCLARIPKFGETRGNLAAGGYGEVRPLTNVDWKISNKIGLTLKDKGLIFVGLDIIGNYLIEVNITSPTCIQQIEAMSSISITSMLMNAIEKRLNS